MDLSNTDKQEKREHFEKLNAAFYQKQKKGMCMFCDCKSKSIGSHSISKNYYLKKIADHGEVDTLSSKREGCRKELIWERIGINRASVFMGYCKKHDDMFNLIDVNGIITVKDLLLQCYRSICFWYKNEMVASEILGAVQKDVDDTTRGVVQRMMPFFDYDQFRFGEDYQKNKFDLVGALQILKEYFENLIIKIEGKAALNERLHNSTYFFDGVEIMHIRVDEKIPVVLNSMNHVSQGEIFHIVLPNDSSTDLICVDATHGKIRFDEAWEARTQNMLNVISLVESWMIGEETWYIAPYVIDRLSEERLTVISDDIRYSQCERALWQPYDVSIFDDLRMKYLNIYREQNILPPDREKKEMERFMIPKRDSKDQRENNLNEAIIKQQMLSTF